MNSIFPQTSHAARGRWMIVDDDENILSLMHNPVARTSDMDIECFVSSHLHSSGGLHDGLRSGQVN